MESSLATCVGPGFLGGEVMLIRGRLFGTGKKRAAGTSDAPSEPHAPILSHTGP
jgi:hypothetical protein